MARCVLPALVGLLTGMSAGLTSPAQADSLYVIDGFVLGEQAEAGRDYRCEPVSHLRDFTRCERTRQERSRRSAFNSTISILSNARGEAVYVNRLIEPAFFGSSDIPSEIARLSTRFGERARETRLPARDDAPSGVIAVWGKLQLEPLDGAALAALGTSDAVAQPLLFDPLGDPKRSAEMGLPVYRLTGGAGYLWSAAHRNGRGHLHFLTIDPSAFVVAPPPATIAKAKPNKLVNAYTATTLAGTAAVPAATVPPVVLQTAAASPPPERFGNVAANVTVVAKSKPDYVVPMLPRNEVERAVLESERLALEYTGSIQLAGATTSVEPPQPPSEYRLETIIALAGVTAVLLFFFASLIERLVREPTGLELLELRRQQGLEDEPEEFEAEDAPVLRVEAERLVLLRVANGLANLATFGDGLRSMLVRKWAVMPHP
jgi:hypothetical protein